jgi:hypothetical protein
MRQVKAGGKMLILWILPNKDRISSPASAYFTTDTCRSEAIAA